MEKEMIEFLLELQELKRNDEEGYELVVQLIEKLSKNKQINVG